MRQRRRFILCRIYGGSEYDYAKCIQETSDGGLILVGYTDSDDGDISFNHGGYDVWILKLSANGNKVWEKTYGGSGNEEGWSIVQTADGGYAIAGSTRSNDGDVTGFHGDCDFWVFKINAAGVLQWQKAIGGASADVGKSVVQTTNNDYVILGYSKSEDGDITKFYGNYDFFLTKLNQTGTVKWTKNFGGSASESGNDVYLTSSGNYLLAGASSSDDHDVDFNQGSRDFWLVKAIPK